MIDLSDRRKAKTEAVAGLTTFFTMAYIVVVNPAILSTPGTGIPFSGALTATVLVCFLMTLFMGIYADLPFAVAPGMGLNAFFAYSIILGKRVPWPAALGIIFWAGVLFVAVSATPVRLRIAEAIPGNLRTASACGIGLFLTFIGLKNAGFIAADPVTFVRLGALDRRSMIALASLALTARMLSRKSPFAFLAGIFAATAAGWAVGAVELPDRFFQWPDFGSVFLKLDPIAALKPSLWPAVVAVLFTDLFDSISTFIGVSEAAGLTDERGQPLRLKEGLLVDAFATLGAGLFGTSSGTAYIESSAGIEVGGRTGLTAVVCSLCFLPCLFLGPLAGVVPAFATAPVLILVGAFMFRSAKHLDLAKLEDALPAYVTIALIPLTFSITQGILWGFIAHAGLYAAVGRGREVKLSSWALALASIALIAIERFQ